MTVATPTLPKICGAGLCAGADAGTKALFDKAAKSASVWGRGASVIGLIGSAP